MTAAPRSAAGGVKELVRVSAWSFGKWLRIFGGARAIALLIAAVGVVAAASWAFWTGPVRTQKNAAVVFCLSPAEHGALVDAAVALNPANMDAGERLKVEGQELTPADWRKGHGSDFTRACDALFAARSQTSGGRGMLESLEAPLSAFVGIVGGVLSTLWASAIARRREQADMLRAAADAFVSATQAYIPAWTTAGAKPSDQDVRACRRDLVAQLGRVPPRWTVAQRLRTELSEGPLGQDLTRDWLAKSPAAREDRAVKLHTDLDHLERVVGDIARALERPGRPHRALRARTRDPQT